MKNVLGKSCRGKQNKRSMFNNYFIFENHSVYEVTWTSNAEAKDENMAYGHCIIDT